MSRQEPGKIVLRVEFTPDHRQSHLVAYDLEGKAWFQTPSSGWPVHRNLLRTFGVTESSLATTDDALASGIRDAQFAAVPLSLATLDASGFTPKTW